MKQVWEIIQLLNELYGEKLWETMTELQIGKMKDSNKNTCPYYSARRIDYVAINISTQERIGYEIKTSRVDFYLNELMKPLKRAKAMLWLDRYYIILGDISLYQSGDEELLNGTGLLFVDGDRISTICEASINPDPMPITRQINRNIINAVKKKIKNKYEDYWQQEKFREQVKLRALSDEQLKRKVDELILSA